MPGGPRFRAIRFRAPRFRAVLFHADRYGAVRHSALRYRAARCGERRLKLFGVFKIFGIGFYMNAAHSFCCSLSNAKTRAFNSIYGKLGGIAPESITMELLQAKCLLCLYYGLEA